MCQDNEKKSEDLGYLKNAIVVNSVAEEYEYISKQRCNCGGSFERTLQQFFPTPFEHDILTVKCVNCGHETDFVFNISGFYNEYTEEILKRLNIDILTDEN